MRWLSSWLQKREQAGSGTQVPKFPSTPLYVRWVGFFTDSKKKQSEPSGFALLPEHYFWELTVACRAPRLGTTLTVVTGL